MNLEELFAQELIDFIYQCASPFHVVATVKNTLQRNGFEELSLTQSWKLEKGKKYYVTKNDSSIFAFFLGNKNLPEIGIKMIATHSDSPCFKIKPCPEIIEGKKYLKLNTEVYGGPILTTWLDRPLSLAGRVILRSDDLLYPNSALVNFNRPLLTIPNLAIHLNREVNEGLALNKQKDMLPLIGIVNDTFEKEGYLVNLLANELQISTEDILDFDLYLYESEKGCLIGANNEMISSSKLDDLAMVHAGLQALINSSKKDSTQMLCIFDNEEVGSSTKQGAGSPVLSNILQRINGVMGYTPEDYFKILYKSFMISADMAHALHPNLVEKHDPILHPVLNGGPVIKYHANQKYTTDSDSGAIFESICKKANVPYQKFANRSDMTGGSTLGNVSVSQLDIRTVDIGNPMLAMHSVRELGGVLDHSYVLKAFTTFYDL
jgi:aspartyl aminopeptidase